MSVENLFNVRIKEYLPELLSSQLVSVQPLSAPVAELYYIDDEYYRLKLLEEAEAMIYDSEVSIYIKKPNE